MSAVKKKLFLVEGGPMPPAAVVRSLRQLYDVEVVPLDRAAAELSQPDGQAVLAEGVSPEVAGRLFAPEAQRIIDSIGQGVCVYSAKSDGVSWSNPRFRSLGETVQRLTTEQCVQAIEAFNTDTDASVQTNEGDSPIGLRRTIHTPRDGAKARYFDVMITPIIEPGENVEAVVAALWDVTDLKRAELKLDAIDRAGAELVRLDAEVMRTLNAAERLRLLEVKIVRYAHDRLEFDHFTIHLLDKESNRLELVMSEGLPREVQEIDLYSSREGNGIVGYVASTGRSYLCQRTTSDERYIPGLAQAHSSLTVPLLMHDQVIGVFNVESDRSNAFSEEDRQFAEMFARYVSLAFHILDLLVVERYTTGETVSSTMEGEINEPLDELQDETQWLRDLSARDPEAADHAERIIRDIESIRRRVTDVRRGPRSILGVDKALKEPSIDPVLEGKRFLVIDDEAGIRETIGDILQRRGAIVELCATGKEGIAALEAGFGPGGDGFDMLISDIKLPDCTGYEIFTVARRQSADLYVILMTGFGYDPHHSIVRASQDGLHCVLFKPFRAQRLLDEVRKPFQTDEPTPTES